MAVMMVLAFAACSKEKSLDSTKDGGPGILRMKVDGVQWNATTGISASIKDGVITITGTSTDKKTLFIELNNTVVDEYDLDQGTDSYATYLDMNEAAPTEYATDQGADPNQAGGLVNVTKIDAATKRISGTFSFLVYRDIDSKQYTITEGVFENLPYTTDEPDPGNPGGGSFMNATIDGAGYTGMNTTGLFNAQLNAIQISSGTGTGPTDIKTLHLMVAADIAVGKYDFATGDVLGLYSIIAGSSNTNFESESGELNITEHNTTTKTIKGTFHFVGKDLAGGTTTANITNGSFSVTYQ